MRKINLIFVLFLNFAINIFHINSEFVSYNDQILLDKLRDNLLTVENGVDPELYKYIENWLDRSKDIFLVNWLHFTERDLTKTEANLRKSLEWRFKNKIDKLANYIPPNYLDKELPFQFSGRTEHGNPVIYAQMGLWNARDIVGRNQRGELIKRFISMLEKAAHEIEVWNNSTENEPIGKFYGIIDMDKFSVSQVTSIRVLGTLSSVLQIAEPNYPLYAERIFIIKAPTFFSVIVNLLKSVLSEKVIGNLYVHGTESTTWFEDIEKAIPRNAIPKNLGGDSINENST